MGDLPILFSCPMVRALLAGTKTQTRRIVDGVPPKPEANCHPAHRQLHPEPYLDSYCSQRKSVENPRGMSTEWCWWQVDDRCCLPPFKVKFKPGDRLWVREAYYQRGHWQPVPGAVTKGGRQKWAFVPADDVILFDRPEGELRLGRHSADPAAVRWHKRLGRFMPRKASRITLLVTDVRLERLQSISEADARAEGVEQLPSGRFYCGEDEEGEVTSKSAVTAYAWLWNDINGEGAWMENPWVAAYTFSVEQVDACEEARGE